MSPKQETRKKQHFISVFALSPCSETRVQRDAEVLIQHNCEANGFCIIKLYDDPGQRMQLSKGAQQLNKKHNWQKQSKTNLKVVNLLASGKKGE